VIENNYSANIKKLLEKSIKIFAGFPNSCKFVLRSMVSAEKPQP
jgi:hypothetical protein